MLQVLSSPVAVTMCVLLFGVSIIVLAIGAVRRRSARNWPIVAVACVVLVVAFGGVWDNVHGGGGSHSSGRGGGGEKAYSAPSDEGLAHPSPKPSLRPFDKKADFDQSYGEADGYLRAAQLNVPMHEVPAAAVAACRIVTFVSKTETPRPWSKTRLTRSTTKWGRQTTSERWTLPDCRNTRKSAIGFGHGTESTGKRVGKGRYIYILSIYLVRDGMEESKHVLSTMVAMEDR